MAVQPPRTSPARLLAAASACLALVALLATPAASTAATPEGGVITNAVVTLGVNNEGHLNYDCVANDDPGGCPPTTTSGTSIVGLRHAPSNLEAIAPGCPCEGWGIADVPSGLAGFANQSTGISPNISVESFSATAGRAIATVLITDPALEGHAIRVTHDYRPSPDTENLFLDTVTVTNAGSQPLGDLRFRRVMDWDVEPTDTQEWVTIQGSAPELIFASDDGFADANPFEGPTYVESETVCGTGYQGTCTFTDLGAGGTYPSSTGPADIGALFDFGLGSLGVGQSKSFRTYYGAAESEATALAALNAAGADLYSLGQPSCEGGTVETCDDGSGGNAGVEQGMPATFMFGFESAGASGPSGPVLAQAPPPVLFDSANAALVSGTVLVKVPGGGFVPLTGEMQIPLGSIVDASSGKVSITSAKNAGGTTQTATFYDGVFRLVQVRENGKVFTQLVLVDGPSSRVLAKKKGTRKLWGNGKGNYKTKGGYGSATVRGTKWLTKDSGAGTLIKVVKGVVSVRDFARKKKTKVRAGKKLLVTPPGRPPGKVR